MKKVALVLLFCFLSSSGLAQQKEQKKEDVFNLGNIVITPSRLYQEYGQVSRATNLITQEEIEDKNCISVENLLEDLPSAIVMENGGLGQVSSVRFRGASSSQTLVLMDNIPLNSPRDGGVNLSEYGTENIDSIEVVRGPSSNLYSSGAVGGTVNILTKRGKTETPQTTISGRFGTYRTQAFELTNSAKIKWFDYFISASEKGSEGCRDNSKYKSDTLNARVGFDILSNNTLTLSGRLHESESGTPGPIDYFDGNDKQNQRQNYVNAIWDSNFDDKLRIKLQSYADLDRIEFTETIYAPLEKSTHQIKNRAVNLQASYCLLEEYTLMAGAEVKKHLLNSSQSGKHSYDVRSLYGLADLRFFDMLDVSGGARIDDYSTFGTEISPSINGALKLGPCKIRALAAKSYRAPTFNDIYWPTEEWIPESWIWPMYGRGAQGNSAIRPEKGKTYEIGADNIMSFNIFDKFPFDTKMGVTLFRTEMKDLINWSMDTSDYYWKPFNVNKARIEGIELEGEAVLVKDIKGVFNYTFTRAKDKDTKKYLTYRPRHKFDMSLSYKHPWGIIGRFRTEYMSKDYSDTANDISIKPYWVFGTDLYYDVGEYTRYFVNIDNMFNRTYEKSKGYPMPGFTITSGMRVRF
ncbi:MAG: TonB-dependent receptor [Candidatus Omnitrophica bacterium]|nr:TonB-dependent receptor [Candidatus Omnitrophota bacterium]